MNKRSILARLSSLIALLALSACKLMPTRPACPAGADLSADMLHGEWIAQVADEAPWTLSLRPHPEHQGSLRGTLTQGSRQHAVVVDLDDGEFTLEESHDGRRIAATWLGSLPAQACGRQIVGQRTQADQPHRGFLIFRKP
jgi:hypothetical protein